MAGFDDEVFGAPPAKPPVHEIGQPIDDLSAPELAERIARSRLEIERLERAIEAREATQATPRPPSSNAEGAVAISARLDGAPFRVGAARAVTVR